MRNRLKQHWFILGLLLVFCLVLADATGTVCAVGTWIKVHGGADLVMVIIFLCSGLMLDTDKIRAGAGDVKGVITALFLIFVCAPALAFVLGKMPFHPGIIVGFAIVSVAPTTLSSGVVMTATAGGNMAHALLISLLSNTFAVVTVPLTLPLVLAKSPESGSVMIDQTAMILKLGTLVLLPLVAGLALRFFLKFPPNKPAATLQAINQVLILIMVGIGLSQAREILFQGGAQIGLIVALVILFHGMMLAIAVCLGRGFRLKQASQKSVLFMGSQKTLPLTLMIQVTVFSTYPLALVVCVLHHLTQLFMDGYLMGRLKSRLSG